MAKTLEEMGFEVIKTGEGDSPESLAFSYVVKGTNTEYGLIRNRVHPHMMFVMNVKTGNPDGKIRGYSWFSDKDGTVRAVK